MIVLCVVLRDFNRFRSGFWQVTSVLVLILSAGVWLRGQDYQKVAPKPVPQREGPVEREKASAETEMDGTPLLPALKGLVFLKDPALVRKEGVSNGEGVKIEGISLLGEGNAWNPRFRSVVTKYLGQPVSLKSLNEMSRDIVRFYREEGLLVVHVLVPSNQDITNGVVQVLVLEGRIGEVRVEGNRYFASDLLSEKLSMEQGDLLREALLEGDVGWINQNPFRHVEPVLARGKNFGETDIILRVDDRFPLRTYGGYEDTGTDLTGDERWLVGMNWGNAFLLDQRLNYQFTTSSDFEKMTAHSGSWEIPLPWRHTLTFFGSYAEMRADIANALFAQTGKSWQASLRYAIPLPGTDPYAHVLTPGFDFKQSNNNLEFGGANVFNTTTDILQGSLDYSGQLDDPWGKTSFGATAYYSPGHLSSRNRNPTFNASRSDAKSAYLYGHFTLDRATPLPGGFSWIFKGVWQESEANLLGSEQLGLGGYNTVRGYEEREANGDSGYLISNEIHAPLISIGSLFGFHAIRDGLTFLIFYDYGETHNHSLLPEEDSHLRLAGVGPGLRYYFGSYLSVRFDYGWQLYDTFQSNNRFDSRGHLGIVLAY